MSCGFQKEKKNHIYQIYGLKRGVQPLTSSPAYVCSTTLARKTQTGPWDKDHFIQKQQLMPLESGIQVSFSSVQFSHSVVSDSFRPPESQLARPPCTSPTPGVHSDSCPSSRWCHPAISSSVIPFSSCPQSLPASESFPMSQLFTSGGQSTGVSALASFLPKKSQGWSPCSPRDSQESSPTP